jgi:hypothetical protein
MAATNDPALDSQIRRWTPDDSVALVFAFIGFVGGVLLLLYYKAPPIVVSFFLATGVAALVYKFLGGIQGTSYAVGALKLGGTLAAIIGIALTINYVLAPQLTFRLTGDKDLLGEWKWSYPEGASAGIISIQKDAQGNLVFTGWQNKYSTENQYQKLYTLSNGKLTLTDRNSLMFSVDVVDHLHGDAHIHWDTRSPIVLRPAFVGEMHATGDHGEEISSVWGIMLYK